MNDLSRGISASSNISFFDQLSDYFAKRETEQFTAARGLENLRLNDFRNSQTANAKIFTAIETVAKQRGLVPDGTYGWLSDNVGIDQRIAHKLGCACNGEIVRGADMVQRIKMIQSELS